MTTATVRSVPGTPSRSNGSAVASSGVPAATLVANGTLGGYAAAVRYGGRGIPKSTHMLRSASSDLGSSSNSVNGESYATDGVTDALSSLALGDSNSITPSISASSSLESPSKLLETSLNGHFSPLGSTLSPLAADPVIEQWNLSPAAPPQPSVTSDVPYLSQSSESSYLASAIGSANGDDAQRTWQTTPWDQAWPSLQQPNQDARSTSSQRSPTSPSFFPMFSTQGMGSPGASMGQSAWNPPEFVPSNGNDMSGGFGGGMIGGSFSGGPGSRFGRSGLGMRGGSGSNGSSYSSLGGFLQPEYLSPQEEPELPLDTAFESIIDDADLGSDEDLEKKQQRLEFAALAPSPADFQQRFR